MVVRQFELLNHIELINGTRFVAIYFYVPFRRSRSIDSIIYRDMDNGQLESILKISLAVLQLK